MPDTMLDDLREALGEPMESDAESWTFRLMPGWVFDVIMEDGRVEVRRVDYTTDEILEMCQPSWSRFVAEVRVADETLRMARRVAEG